MLLRARCETNTPVVGAKALVRKALRLFQPGTVNKRVLYLNLLSTLLLINPPRYRLLYAVSQLL